MKLVSARLLVSDFDACFRFYRDVMGLQATFGAEGDGYANFDVGGGFMLELFPRSEMADAVGAAHLPAQAASQDRVVISFSDPEVAVDDLLEQLRAKGANVAVEPTDHPDWGVRTVHLRDPDGNLIELYSSIPMGS